MSSAVIVRIFDVDNQPVIGCDVECIEGSTSRPVANSGANQFACIPQDPTFGETWTITVRHNDFFAEKTNIHVQDMKWTNPTCSLTRGTEAGTDTVRVRFVLSRIRLAERVPLIGNKPPTGVLLADGANRNSFDYRFLFNGDRPGFLSFADKIIDAKGKLQFKAANSSLDASAKGYFRWLEIDGGGNTYAVAIWVPKDYFKVEPILPKRKVDFILVLSPTTKGKPESYTLKKGHTYPYGLNDPQIVSGGPFQPFIHTLGQEYFFHRIHLTFQLISAHKKAILVMPINNLEDWGPFANKLGAHRLLLEVAHFTHKHLLYDPQTFDQLPDVAKSIPDIGKVVIAAYSSGAIPLLGFFQPPPKNLHPLSSIRSAKTTFESLWTEIWDIDADLKLYAPSKPTWAQRLLGFLSEGEHRRVRMYHGDHIAHRYDEINPWRPSKDVGIGKLIPADPAARAKVGLTIKDDAGRILAEEYHLMLPRNRQLSVVYLSTIYLKNNQKNPGTIPPFPKLPEGTTTKILDAQDLALHGYIANHAFGHAARMSSLGELPP